MKLEVIQFGFIGLLAFAVHMPVHGQDDRNTSVANHQKKMETISADSNTTSNELVSVVASNLPLMRVIAQLENQSGQDIRVKGMAGETKVTTILPNRVPLTEALERLAEQNDLIVRKTDTGYDVWNPREYLQQAQEARVYALSEAQAEDIVGLVQPILTYKQGTVKVDDRLNSLVVYDVPEKQKIAAALIKELDQKLYTRVYALEHALPSKLANQLSNLMGLSPSQIVADDRTNQVIFRSTMTNLKLAEDFVETLDIPTPANKPVR